VTEEAFPGNLWSPLSRDWPRETGSWEQENKEPLHALMFSMHGSPLESHSHFHTSPPCKPSSRRHQFHCLATVNENDSRKELGITKNGMKIKPPTWFRRNVTRFWQKRPSSKNRRFPKLITEKQLTISIKWECRIKWILSLSDRVLLFSFTFNIFTF